MRKKWLGVVMLPTMIIGCTSMLPHYRFADHEVTGQAQGMAIAMSCVEKGLAPGAPVYAYGYAVSQLYSVSVYNKRLYEETYQNTKSQLDAYFPDKYLSGCSEISSQFPRMTDNILQQYRSISQDRQAALAGMSQSAASIGNNLPTYSQPSTIMPSGQVTFGLPENQSNHYLVNFGGGQRMCTATSSGYVFCN